MKVVPVRASAVVALAVVIACCGCGSSTSAQPVRASAATTNQNATAPAAVPNDVPASRDADDVARFLSGLPSRPGSPYAELEETAIWKEHRAKLDEMWKRADTDFVGGMRGFGESTLKQDTGSELPVFYPFGGPDSLTAVEFFPHAPYYVLVALEPTGTLPRASQLQKKDLPLYFGAIRQSLSSVLGRSFFVTREMDKEFRGQLADGLMLPILSLLVRTDHQILGLRNLRINEEGRVVDWPADNAEGTKYKNRGIEIAIQGKNSPPQTLYYFSVNLDDKHLQGNTGFQAYVKSLGSVKTMLKATSYMTHHPEFSAIRNDILAQSEAVVQDDSGIPYKFFDPTMWQVHLFGDYEKPYGSFRWLEQPNLRAAYHSPGVEQLPFRIGYGFHRAPSNLLLARRLTTAAQAKSAN